MNNLDLNKILNREEEVLKLKQLLIDFELNKHDLTAKKGIYIYGESGVGKTTFVMNLLKEMDFDIVKWDGGDVRNKLIIETITRDNMSNKNILSTLNKKVKKIIIIMDEIESINSGDRGGLNGLIKLIRPKKTKKQKLEELSLNPIICIGNYHIDKKIKELMKVCNVVELKIPTVPQITTIVKSLMPNLNEGMNQIIINYLQHDLKKLNNIVGIYKNKPDILTQDLFNNIFQLKSYNDDTKKITQKLINNKYPIESHLSIMNETDRTIVGLLWHENIIDVLAKVNKETSIPFYLKVLENMCYADYIDRITFQKQIWQFNEMSSLIKTFKNNKLYHETFKKKPKFNPVEIRFTKVLTKYSTEYNNSLFIQNLCQQLGMDQKDLFSFFLNLKNKHADNEIFGLFENYEITKLDINRIYRYLENYTKETVSEEDIGESDNELEKDNSD
jgi:GTPase SAR1 family protein